MGTQLHEALRSLCLNTDWKYAVFWKLKLGARTLLSWEDAYFGKHDPSENRWSSDMASNLYEEYYAPDPLELAVAKMAYHTYSLGEGIVGQVAVTGQHFWIYADKYLSDSCSSLMDCNGWQIQFSAGIKTIAVVAVGEYGVLQLGSLNKIAGDLKLVKCIRDAFFGVQDSSVGCILSSEHFSLENSSYLSDVSTRSSGFEAFHNNMCDQQRLVAMDRKNILEPESSPLKKTYDSFTVTLPCSNLKRSVVGSRETHAPSQSSIDSRNSSCNAITKVECYDVDISHLPPHHLDSSTCDKKHGASGKELGKNLGIKPDSYNMNILSTSFEFSSGGELHEALGPAFPKQTMLADWDILKSKTETFIEMPEVTNCSSMLTSFSSADYLLDAVVANVCYSESDDKALISYRKSVDCQLRDAKALEPLVSDMPTISSNGYSFGLSTLVEETSHRLDSSETCTAKSSKGFSSPSSSKGSENLQRPRELGKMNKKKARPGENSRPRPRDRQLIQDRIKELRGLIPNGAKCSIDSLLERTIKHMLFMQSIAKHSDKLNACGESKLLGKKRGVQGSSNYEQGSSWAVEVGNHFKICPIIVENINANGMMLVEMLCEECGHFLEIAEAIRSIGLTILKGATEAYDDKTWMCYVVEGQNNRSMHRVEVLWSLVQMLQSTPEL